MMHSRLPSALLLPDSVLVAVPDQTTDLSILFTLHFSLTQLNLHYHPSLTTINYDHDQCRRW